MSDATLWPWIVLLVLGAAHGLNPGMGWLFAVALGVQRGERRAVWRALLALGIGHGLAVAAVLALAATLGLMIPIAQLRWLIGVTLLAAGVLHWRRHRHPRWGGMRITGRELVAWSFLMATAHGAGLMALPFALDAGAIREVETAHATPDARSTPATHAPAPHAHHATAVHGAASTHGAAAGTTALLATLVHSAGYLLVTGLIAVLVYERLGLRLLRRGWINVDRLWAAALIVTAVVVLLP